ncbi:MAG: hypothetical protein WD115_02050 [Balneolaceae bacterium]
MFSPESSRFQLLLLGLFSILVVTEPVHAQMFSQGSTNQEQTLGNSQLMIGTEWIDFNYQGPTNPTALPTDRYDVQGNALILQLETQTIDMYIRGLGKLTGSSNESMFNLGARLHNQFQLFRKGLFRIHVPIQLHTDLLRTRRDASNRQFQQTIVQAGAGLASTIGSPRSVQATFSLLPSYGFSNSAGAFFGGSVRSLQGRSRIQIPGILPNRMIVIGYDYRFRKYDIDIDSYDYQLQSHTVVIGFTF